MLIVRKALLLAAHEDDLRQTDTEVILVEDDPSVLRALRRLLVVSGFKVSTFVRPSSLLAVSVPDPDVCLIFDVHLPEMTGVELYQALAASGCRSPLILITGWVDNATREMAKRLNAAAVLTKPFSRASLVAAIHRGLASGQHPS